MKKIERDLELEKIRDAHKLKGEKVAYMYRKSQVLEREKRNYQRVILFRVDEKWWKMAGKSVLYYTKLIAPRLQKTVKVWPDRDYGEQSKEGVVLIADIDKLLKQAKEMKLKVEGEDSKDYRAIVLGNKISGEELRSMVGEEKERWALAERMIMPAVVWPGIKQKATEMLTYARSVERRLEASSQRMVGDDMMRALIDIVVSLNSAARGHMEPMAALVQITEDIDKFDGMLMAVMGMRLVETDRAYQLAMYSTDLKKIINKEIAKTARREKEIKNGKEKEDD